MFEFESFARGHSNLHRNKVHARHTFRDGVLDLNSRIHFEEIELPPRIEQKLAGTRTDIIDGLGRKHGSLTHRRAPLSRHPVGRRFFDKLLMPSLNRTFTLTEMKRVPMRIGHHLNFDMPRTDQAFFEIDRSVPKGGFGFT